MTRARLLVYEISFSQVLILRSCSLAAEIGERIFRRRYGGGCACKSGSSFGRLTLEAVTGGKLPGDPLSEPSLSFGTSQLFELAR